MSHSRCRRDRVRKRRRRARERARLRRLVWRLYTYHDDSSFWSATTEEIMEAFRLAVLRVEGVTDAWWHTGPGIPGLPPRSYEVVIDGG